MSTIQPIKTVAALYQEVQKRKDTDIAYFDAQNKEFKIQGKFKNTAFQFLGRVVTAILTLAKIIPTPFRIQILEKALNRFLVKHLDVKPILSFNDGFQVHEVPYGGKTTVGELKQILANTKNEISRETEISFPQNLLNKLAFTKNDSKLSYQKIMKHHEELLYIIIDSSNRMKDIREFLARFSESDQFLIINYPRVDIFWPLVNDCGGEVPINTGRY